MTLTLRGISDIITKARTAKKSSKWDSDDELSDFPKVPPLQSPEIFTPVEMCNICDLSYKEGYEAGKNYVYSNLTHMVYKLQQAVDSKDKSRTTTDGVMY